MTEYSNVINCSRTLRNILVIGNKKKSRVNSKTYQINSETDHRKYLEKWRNKCVYYSTKQTERSFVEVYIYAIIKGTDFPPPLDYTYRHL